MGEIINLNRGGSMDGPDKVEDQDGFDNFNTAFNRRCWTPCLLPFWGRQNCVWCTMSPKLIRALFSKDDSSTASGDGDQRR